MTSSDPLLILDISSDDEEPDIVGGGGGGVGFGGDREDHNWLSELLGEVDRNNSKLVRPNNYVDNSDDDDVVVLGEFFPKPKKKSRLIQSSKKKKKVSGGDVDDDGDCVVLDENPEKTVLLGGNGGNDDDSDDLVIVGEKGEVACRDFPHSRHLCVKFPFASTPHNVHCSQCHCYVCDTLAPCTQWGTTSISSIDHCHASDKEEYWRAERKSSKLGVKPMPVPLTTSNASFVPGVHQITQLPASTPLNPNSLLPTRGLGKGTMRSCSTSYNTSVPNVINQGRLHPVGGNSPRNISQVPAVSPHSHTAFKSNVSLNNKSSRLAPIRVMLKKTGASPNNVRGQSGNVENRSSRPSSTSAVLKRTESTGASPSSIRFQSGNVENRSSKLSSIPAVLKRTDSTGASPNNIRGQSSNVENRSSKLSSTSEVLKRPGSTGASPNNIRGQSCNVENRRSRLSSTSAVLKRTESTGASPNIISGLNERSYTQSQSPRDPSLKRIKTPTLRDIRRPHLANSAIKRKLSAPPSINVRYANVVSSLPTSITQVRDSATLPQINSSSHSSRNFGNAVSFEPQVTSQPDQGNFESMDLSPPNLVFQPTGSISSPNFLSNQSSVSKTLLNQHSRSTTSSSSNTCNTFEGQSSHPLAYDQNNFQEVIQTPSDLDMCSLNFDFELDYLQAPSTGIPQVENFNQRIVEPASNSSLLDNIDSRLATNPDTLDFQFESWLFENQPSPEPSSIDDAGTLFDVEVKTR